MSKEEAVAELPAKDVRALVKQAEDKFKADIEALLGRRKQLAENLLQWRHDIGKVASRIVCDRSKALHERTYGAHVIEDVAGLLGEAPKVIYACSKFAELYSDKELQDMQAKEWPWRGVLSLLTVEDAKAREKFQKKWEDGKFKNTDELKTAVAEYNGQAVDDGTKKERRGRKSGGFAGPVKTTDTIMTKFTSDTLPGFIKAMDAVSKAEDLDEQKREALQEHLDHIRELIPAMKQMLTDAEKAIKATKL